MKSQTLYADLFSIFYIVQLIIHRQGKGKAKAKAKERHDCHKVVEKNKLVITPNLFERKNMAKSFILLHCS
jgi:hypothetical protein